MLGAIIGDIVGSRFEFNNHRSTDFELFHPDCTFTDDTICTVAIANWLLRIEQSDDQVIKYIKLHDYLKMWCQKYPNPAGGYGGRFREWVFSNKSEPYDSFGNGSAMRVSPVAWAFDDYFDVYKYAEISARITHDHPDGVKGAQSIASIIYALRKGADKNKVIKTIMDVYEYPETYCCMDLRNLNTFNETCQGTIPVCLQCLKESTDFESAIRLAVSVGGDTDTIAAITGSMAEAAYGIPKDIWRQALAYLPGEMIDVISNFINTFGYGKE